MRATIEVPELGGQLSSQAPGRATPISTKLWELQYGGNASYFTTTIFRTAAAPSASTR